MQGTAAAREEEATCVRRSRAGRAAASLWRLHGAEPQRLQLQERDEAAAAAARATPRQIVCSERISSAVGLHAQQQHASSGSPPLQLLLGARELSATPQR